MKILTGSRRTTVSSTAPQLSRRRRHLRLRPWLAGMFIGFGPPGLRVRRLRRPLPASWDFGADRGRIRLASRILIPGVKSEDFIDAGDGLPDPLVPTGSVLPLCCFFTSVTEFFGFGTGNTTDLPVALMPASVAPALRLASFLHDFDRAVVVGARGSFCRAVAMLSALAE